MCILILFTEYEPDFRVQVYVHTHVMYVCTHFIQYKPDVLV